jgi:hypothetical protein
VTGRRTSESSPTHALAFVAVAVVGLLVGHALSYAFAVPDPYHRDLVLRDSGHGYLPGLTELAFVLVVGAVAGLVGSAATGRAARLPRLGNLAGPMVATQVVAFVGLEVAERLVSHASLGDLIRHDLLAIGVATQVVVALAGAAVLAWIARASGRVASMLRVPPGPAPRRPILSLAPSVIAPSGTASPAADPIRGPPPR